MWNHETSAETRLVPSKPHYLQVELVMGGLGAVRDGGWWWVCLFLLYAIATVFQL